MTEKRQPALGTVLWHDLTVRDAESVRDFYAAVVGWRAEPVDMPGYQDYSMMAPATGAPVAGVCHARGVNAQLPPQWLPYVAVANLDVALRACLEKGGTIVDGPRGLGEQRFAVIRDPAGAHLALLDAPKAAPA